MPPVAEEYRGWMRRNYRAFVEELDEMVRYEVSGDVQVDM